MTKLRLLTAALAALAALAISRPAGVDSGRTGSAATASAETPAPGALVADPGASAETTPLEIASSALSHCTPEVLDGIPATESIVATLAASQDPEHLLTAAVLILDADPARGAELLARAWNANPAHSLVAMTRLDACQAHPGVQACASDEIEAAAIRVDGTNGALWARIAVRRYAQRDESAALHALHRAATSPRYDAYWIDHARLFERALTASTRMSYVDRTLAAIGIAAGMWQPELEVVKACRNEIGLSPEWRPACGDFGRRLEADGETLEHVATGLFLQEALYEAMGDKQNLAVASRKRQEIDEIIHRQYRARAEAFLFSDEHLLSDYLAEFDAHGELAATRFLRDEVTRLKALPGYAPCG